jgi:hypothetical protein
MVFVAISLIVLGFVVATLGFKMFRILLPLLGFVSGVMVGFTGVQGIFGTGAVSSTIALVVALILGLVMGVLSFVFFDIALVVLATVLGASALSYLGVALGLGEQGFIMFILSVSGGILGFMASTMYPIGPSLVITLSSMYGVAMGLAGTLLLVGDVTLAELNDEGIISSVVRVVDQSFLWFFVWVAGSIVALNAQKRILIEDFMSNEFEYKSAR